ncbi:Guanine nucleotide-binding-like protein 1 [Lobosporangium transversale]|nr:Guanine nucleotide-binding-like protein 1 [Lobosporangium transversale]
MPRPKAFSGALKKKQLQERRARHNKKVEGKQNEEHTNNINNNATVDSYNGRFVKSLSNEPKQGSHGSGRPVKENSNHPAETRLRSVFIKRSQAEIEESRRASMQPLHFLPESKLEVSFEEMFPEIIGFPKRPKWDYSMSPQQLEQNETRMFEAWMDSVYNQYPAEELSYFEHNLEVWRQLWRVLEISDIIMIIVDIRHPVIHFPPSLYQYVVEDMKRKLVVIDLVAPSTVFAWKQYFKEKFPELHIASFSCYSPDPTFINDSSTAAIQRAVKRPRRRFYNAVGVRDVLMACKDVELAKNGDQVDWDLLVAQYDADKRGHGPQDSDEEDDRESDGASDNTPEQDGEDGNQEQESLLKKSDAGLSVSLQTVDINEDEHVPHKDYVTIGLVGHPNVGKSSLINSIMGRTVVSTSKTPGHTKHFQTIHLTHNVRLCDSPGLVFPSLLPKALQILSGMYPVAQVQEPYSVVQYLAERVNIPRLLKLDPPPNYERGPFRWSSFGVCEAYALQRGFLTAKSAHPDVYRAANAILRLANDGRILLSFKPPGFFTSTKYEKLKVTEADDAFSATASGSDDRQNERRKPSATIKDDENEEDLPVEEEVTGKESNEKGSFKMNARIGGFFGLLQEDEDENDGDEDDDEDDDEDAEDDAHDEH